MSLKSLLEEQVANGTETGLDKYAAQREDVVRPIMARLLETDREAFDLCLWLVWWSEFYRQGCRWRENMIADAIQTRVNAPGGNG